MPKNFLSDYGLACDFEEIPCCNFAKLVDDYGLSGIVVLIALVSFRVPHYRYFHIAALVLISGFIFFSKDAISKCFLLFYYLRMFFLGKAKSLMLWARFKNVEFLREEAQEKEIIKFFPTICLFSNVQ